MNTAATQDLRCELIVPTLVRVLGRAEAPSERDAATAKTLSLWRVHGCDRLDRDLDGRIDEPGAAILDEAWPRVADAVMRSRLGPLTDRLKRLIPVDDPANAGGSSYYNGWYSYVVRDLGGGFASGRFCPPDRCRALLWDAIDAAGRKLVEEQGPDPSRWRADATRERLRFGFLPQTARWTNRPTFQQVVTFNSHRRR
jgi:hypothetical protein